MVKEVTLKVAKAVQEDVAMGRVRVDAATRLDLNLTVGGGVVEILGKNTTAAIVWRGHPDDEGKGIIRMDGLIRDNAGVSIGDKVRVRKADVSPANRIVLAPVIDEGQKQFGSGIEGVVKRGLFKRPVTKGDTVIVRGIALALGGRALPFIVVDVNPGGIVQVTENTEVHLREEGNRVTPWVVFEVHDCQPVKRTVVQVERVTPEAELATPFAPCREGSDCLPFRQAYRLHLLSGIEPDGSVPKQYKEYLVNCRCGVSFVLYLRHGNPRGFGCPACMGGDFTGMSTHSAQFFDRHMSLPREAVV